MLEIHVKDLFRGVVGVNSGHSQLLLIIFSQLGKRVATLSWLSWLELALHCVILAAHLVELSLVLISGVVLSLWLSELSTSSEISLRILSLGLKRLALGLEPRLGRLTAEAHLRVLGLLES